MFAIPNLPVSRLVHDLLNPIASVKANLEFIAQSVSGEVREAAVEAAVELCRAERMLRDIQDLDRLARGELPIYLASASLAEVAKGAILEVAPAAAARGVKIELRGDARAPCDIGLMRRLIVNLLSIALRYGPERVPIDLTIEVEGDRARITVLDRGPAVAQGERAILGGDEAASAPPRPGAALGLAFSEIAARAQNALLQVEAREGGSATIIVI
ncbi:MAG: HAMP domain-containing sensor histidine kinase [Myxococcota bacterium]